MLKSRSLVSKSLLLSALLGSTVLTAAPAAAQEAAENLSDHSLAEITVTARRRSENLQETPLSIASLGAEQLESMGVSNALSLQGFVPNVQMVGAGGFGSPSGNIIIRGIGIADASPDAEPGVAVYLDDILVSDSTAAMLNIVDLERVEVLRGPQGTLFGKNAIGGAVRYVSREPTDRLEGQVQGTVGSYWRKDLVATVNVPLADGLATRWTAAYLSDEGYVKRINRKSNTNDKGDLAFRGQLRWEATPALTLLVRGSYLHTRNNGVATKILGIRPNSSLANTSGMTVADTLPDEPYRTTSDLDTFQKTDAWNAAATLSWTVAEGITVKAIGSYAHSKWSALLDRDGSIKQAEDFYNKRVIDEWSQEFQVAGDRPGLKWVVGLFNYGKDSDSPSIRHFLACCGGVGGTGRNNPATDRDQLETRSKAAFAEATVDPIENLSITGGIRYTDEKKRRTYYQNNNVGGVSTFSGRTSYSATTWRLSALYRFTSNVSAYASVATGYRSGGFNRTVFQGTLIPYGKETATTYEGGLRSELFDRRVRFNLTYFRTIYNDIQIESLGPDGLTGAITNVAKARIQGLEGELVALLADGLQLDLSGGTLRTRYLDLGPNPTTVPVTLDSKRIWSPKFSFTAGLSYTHELSNGAKVKLRSDYGWQDDAWTSASASERLIQKAYGKLNARISYTQADGIWEASLFGTNILDKTYMVAGIYSAGGGRSWNIINYGRPAEFGASFKYNF